MSHEPVSTVPRGANVLRLRASDHDRRRSRAANALRAQLRAVERCLAESERKESEGKKEKPE
jgi:hypothetical protein